MRPSLPVPDDVPIHQPVLLAETLEHLAPAPGRRYLDCTLGLGGHAEALLEAGASVLGVDRDPAARARALARLARFGAALEVRGGTFAQAAAELAAAGPAFDGVLADLGVSSLQLDDVARGFSLRSTERLDMRMGEGAALDALALIDSLPEDALADVIYTFGEERLSRRIARALKTARAQGRLESGAELADAVRRVVPGHARRHPALRTFQALRIAVNDELGELARLLPTLPQLLRAGGIAVIISFHSLEDRAVKQAFRAGLADGVYARVAKRVIEASDAEVAANPRARPAKLRWAVRAESRPAAPHAHPRLESSP